jgi:alginate O-acetyltransferase complex protein AlgJ
MLATGSGLPENLAAKLGFVADVVGVRGSGATPSRVNLRRRGDNLAGKKMIIWIFTAREFTEGSGWKLVPVIGSSL